MNQPEVKPETLSPWWRRAVVLVMAAGFAILIWMSFRAYEDAPPIPGKAVGPRGDVLFTGEDVLSGQEVFLKYGLMQNGTIWGHGAYLGPDFSAEYLHTLAVSTASGLARQMFNRDFPLLTPAERAAVRGATGVLLKQNRYQESTDTWTLTGPEAESYRDQIAKWTAYFKNPIENRGLLMNHIQNPKELQQLTAFFAWTAWASVTNRPGKTHTYTNNFPYDPDVGNVPTPSAYLWSGLSLVALLAGIAIVLFAFGRFDFLGWKGAGEHIHPKMVPGEATESQRATIKYFVVVAVFLLAQSLLGGATAHYRADPGSFYGINLSAFVPSNLFRTWHLQIGLLWIATGYVAGGLFLAVYLGAKEPKGQATGVHLLFWAVVIVAVGSLLGEMLGIYQLMGDLWFWLGDQGWEYLDLGRAWQVLLAIGLVFWLILIARGTRPAIRNPKEKEISTLFLLAAVSIPLFYLPAMFFGSRTNFTVVDSWRFWIIHLWVEGFFELFVTTMVAVLFYKLGMVTRLTATRVIYLDAILFLGGGLVGTAHHWYWTGQSAATMAFAAMYSALEVVPLTLLTLDAWDFIKLSRARCEICRQEIAIPHKWTFYFMMSVGFWNFVGAGIFGFLINLPIISYFEVGTILTANHGHSALMGVFGMFAISFMVFAMRQVLSDAEWPGVEKYVRVSFWGLNVGLALMVLLNLFPGGILQLIDVFQNGYWHARGFEFLNRRLSTIIEWVRLPADVIFIVAGVLPAVIAAVKTYVLVRQAKGVEVTATSR
jgi:nitric oxide reductase subunit B